MQEEKSKLNDILLCEEESVDAVNIKCINPGCNSGFIIENNTAIKCPNCYDLRQKEVRRSRLSSVPVHLRRYPVHFDVNVDMVVVRKDMSKSDIIEGSANVENKINNKLVSMCKNGHSAYIFGNPGTGKTMTACGIAVKFIDDGKTAVYILASELLDLSFSQVNDAAKIKTIFSADLLIIDDLGSEFADSKQFKLSFFDKILASRFVRRKPTIITSNLQPSSLTKRYGHKRAQQIMDEFIMLGIVCKDSFNSSMTDNAAEEFMVD